MDKMLSKLGAFSTAVSLGIFGLASTALMAADSDVVSSTGAMVTNVKDTGLSVINNNITSIMAVGILVFFIGLAWVLFKRFSRGR